MDDLTLQEIRWWMTLLAHQREEKGFSYRTLSEKTQIPVSTLHKILRYNMDEVKLWQLMEIGKALDVRRITLNVPIRASDV